LEGIEGATNKDIADAIVAFVEENARPNGNKVRGKG
jgi:ribosomal protein S6--L-glutamate ligase